MHLIKGRNRVFRYATKKIQIYLHIVCIYTEFIKSIIIHVAFTQKSWNGTFISNKYFNSFYYKRFP